MEVSKRRKGACAIIVFWLSMMPLGAYFAYLYFGNTELLYEAPKGSMVANTEDIARRLFTTQILHNPLYVLFESKTGHSMLTPEFALFCESLTSTFSKEADRRIIDIKGYFFPPAIPEVQAAFVGANGSSTLVIFDIDDGMESFHVDAEQYMTSWQSSHNLTDRWSFKTTSVDQIAADLQEGILGDLAKIDAITFPFAVAALAYCVRSVRMLVLPLIAVLATFCSALGLMYPVSLAIKVSSFAPELSAAVMIAVTTDYSLFILSRFNEQVKLQEATHSPDEEETRWIVVRNTTRLSAENILVSGLTIAAALGGLALLPVSFLATIGIAFAISCVCAVTVSLTLLPALLFVFYSFFRVPTTCSALTNRCKRSESQKEASSQDQERSSLSPLEIHQAEQRRIQNSSIWFKIGTLAFRRPILVSLLVCAVGVPFFYLASELRVDFDLFNQVPRSSPHGTTLKQITMTIGGGEAIPFYVVVDSGRPEGLWDDEVFQSANALVKNIHQLTNQPLDRINGFAYVQGLQIDRVATAQALINHSAAYAAVFDGTVDVTRQLGMLVLSPTFDPFSSGANEFLDGINDAISLTYFQRPRFNATLGVMGASAESWAIMRKVMSFFPIQIGITFGIIFIFIGIVFRSIFIPLRMLFTVAYTVGFAFGFGVLIFQYSWSHEVWTAMDGVNSYVWLVPIMSFSLLCALALDYDVFLLTRIIELKRIGFVDEAAIAKGVWKTGRIISFAGVIMAISFGSLMLSNVTMLNQFGLISFSAVLVDTFLIRPLFTPSLMSVLPALSWWPRQFTPVLSVDDMDECRKEERSLLEEPV